MTGGGGSAIEHDPDGRARAAAAYAGPHPFENALRWREDPEVPALDGRPSPFAGLAAARRAVYAPDADGAARGRLAALQAAVAENRSAVDAAFAAVQRDLPGEPRDRPAADPDEPATAYPAAAVVAANTGPLSARLRRSASVAVPTLLAILAFVVGLAVAPTLGRAGGASPTVAPKPTYAPFTVAPSGRITGLSVFRSPQSPADRPSFRPGSTLLTASFRLLGQVSGTGVSIYAAQTDTHDVCLVALAADERLGASCASVADFRKAPLTLDITAAQDPVDLAGSGSRIEIQSFWSYARGSGWAIVPSDRH